VVVAVVDANVDVDVDAVVDFDVDVDVDVDVNVDVIVDAVVCVVVVVVDDSVVMVVSGFFGARMTSVKTIESVTATIVKAINDMPMILTQR
jgi:hypothetical protein